MSFFNTSSSSTPAATAAVEKDVEVADPPGDSISSLAFSPIQDYLAVGSWDNNVRVYRRCLGEWVTERALDLRRSGYMK